MGMYSSFKLIAVIDEPYREWFDRLLTSDQSTYKEEAEIHEYINHLYRGQDGFFNVNREYSKDTGILVCGRNLKNYGHIPECEGDEIEFCIKNSVLPFGEVIEYYTHEDDMCCDCTCSPQEQFNSARSFNDKKRHYMNKYKELIDNFGAVSINPDETKVSLNDKMKEFLKKDIESILERYNNYNFDLAELKKSLDTL